ncbi:hypothetical protein M407DRAFT_34356 [Tulasnella calospora MUT 4182]|uniref:F-box domain-containing protein n=1 Tax=Tulasnella calospora MUT 4182 TaxID=1051891 RepID=A0A0C3PNK7_9AGAM|nr:hypothetical protein M407DRAFT_34356 [Tulasnella calospora MUT 4182]
METSSSHWDPARNGATSQDPNSGVPPILQLPTEILAEIFRLVLPSVDFFPYVVEVESLAYVRMLYGMRLIGKRWQEIIDGTPTFWTFVLSALPPHINKATINCSDTGPLTIIYATRDFANGYNHPSAKDFLDAMEETFPRWSAYIGPCVAGYIDRPAPNLQTIVLWDPSESDTGAFDLLGGSTTNLRHVDLSRIHIQWETGFLTQLKVLRLAYVFHGDLTTTQFFDTLRASPGLEQLRLDDMYATIDHPPSLPAVTLPRLRYIQFYRCPHDFTGAILRQIRALSCSDFNLNILLDDEGLHEFLNDGMGPFEELLHAIHERNGSSEIRLDMSDFEWDSSGEGVENHPTFSVFILCHSPVPCIHWVKRILQSDPGLGIRFISRTSLLPEVFESFAPMRCVTRVEIGDIWGRDRFLVALRFIGEPQRANPSLPSLPCLRELVMTGTRWTAQDLLDTVPSRFNSQLWEDIEPTLLTITLPRGAFDSEGEPQPILDFATLARIRGVNGVECVRFVGADDLDGTLAITWDEDASAPAPRLKWLSGLEMPTLSSPV